ncbi:MAG TPA: MG2 domain-containing protein [Terriglobales bacterium]|jgi:hypothetical protein|nr:MG2 domain-containing protein [Terriglobales bacterium]
MTTLRQVAVVSFLICLTAGIVRADDFPKIFHVPEDKIEFQLYPEPRLVFVGVNSSKQPIEGEFSFEIVDIVAKNQHYEESVFAFSKGTFKEQPGETTEKLPWTVKSLPSTELATLAAMRLRYSFTPKPGYDFAPVHGVLQFGKIFRNRFNLSMMSSANSAPGTSYPVRVRVDDPATGRPLANIPVELEFEISECTRDADEKNGDRTLTTDSSGYGVVTFHIDRASTCTEGKVNATAIRGGFSDSASTEFKLPDSPSLRLSTDKPLYQPGQTVHMRLLAVGPNRHALVGAKLKLTIGSDESQEQQFERVLTTSNFGIAAADWEIPRKLELGEYRLKAELSDTNDSNETEAVANIRISRYELPTFTVKVKPDRTYYIRGQNALIEVSGDYLFGKPVQQAKVRVVRQDNGEWDSKTGRWTADESSPVLGEFDRTGKFVAAIDLQPDAKFEESDYARFKDLDFAAYVTDLSTGRTEQRRFKLRVTVQAIHLYVAAATYERSGEPRDVYITSAYADGMPAEISGRVRPAGGEDGKPLAQFRTNEYGLARVRLPHIAEASVMVRGGNCYYSGSQERVIPLTIDGEDANGLRGTFHDELPLQAAQNEFIEVTADRALYRPGEPIRLSLLSSANDGEFVVDIVTPKGVLASQVLRLHDRRGELLIPYDSRFLGVLTVQAYSLETPHAALHGSTRVIYARPDELKLSVRMPQTTFRPGEIVSTDIDVRTPQGDGIASALGLVVFDQAVAERLRTEQDFGDYGFSAVYDFDYSRYGSIAGIGLRDLLVLDPKRSFSNSLQMLAEALLLSSPYALRDEEQGEEDGGSYSEYSLGYEIHQWMQQQLQPAKELLGNYVKRNSVYPPEHEFLATLKSGGVDFESLRDPWDVPYRVAYSTQPRDGVITIYSNGPDKVPNTADDVEVTKFSWSYFNPIANKIRQATIDYFERTSNYIRDYPTLRDEIKRKGVDLDTLQDPWRHPYQFKFDIAGPSYVINVVSGGPDGVITGDNCHDILESSSYVHYFQREDAALVRALAEHYAKTGIFPKNEEELKPVLAASGLTKEQLLDPWGHPYQFKFDERAQYGDRTDIDSFAVYPNQPVVRTRVTPVTQQVAYISVQSAGPPKQQYPFEVSSFSRVLSEQSSKDAAPVLTSANAPLGAGRGTISGTVSDPSGAVIPNATIVAIAEDNKQYTATTNTQGGYTLATLPAGFYEVSVTANAFMESLILKVPVRPGEVTKLDAALRVAPSTQTVTVSAALGTLQTSAETVLVTEKMPRRVAEPEIPLFTPRVRKNFTETLLWRPEVITDEHGHAHVSFPMADSITAWNMSMVASTQDGQIGVADRQLRSFQPLFIEHDPPKTLTEGDRISLPVVLRNYTDKILRLQAEISPAPWSSLLSQPKQQVSVPANGNASVVFAFRADASTRNGKQRISARDRATGDAVEHEISVHPDGQQITFTAAKILAGNDNTMNVDIPATAIPGSSDIELMLYPSLVAHVLEAMQGIGMRPVGCAEQITSTAYVNLLGLQLLKKQGTIDGSAQADLVAQAKQSVQSGYEQLVSSQREDGGFGYWKTGSSDVALTAYVLRFLTAAKDYVEVDPTAAHKAQHFLLAKQKNNGSWTKWDWSKEREVEDAQITSEVARSLAVTLPDPKQVERKAIETSLKAAMDYLDLQAWRDAYMIGNYAIAASAMNDKQLMAQARASLAELAHPEGSSTYWNLETNTSPFYGWGNAGRLETTALAVQALAALSDQSQDANEQVSRGVQYLLSHKDPYQVWYSTHATLAAVEALATAIPVGNDKGEGSKAILTVNGHEATSVDLPAAKDVVGAIAVDLTEFLRTGTNAVQVLRAENGAPMNAQAITSYYVPWNYSSAVLGENVQRGETRALRLNVHYDQTAPKVDEPVRCEVQVERIGFVGYGMMVAEIGLPPGSEVDRQSLQDSGQQYEVRPDRVVFYVWPSAAGTKLSFSFKTRYRMNANTSPSILYDYYNPEANATVAPVRFAVQ